MWTNASPVVVSSGGNYVMVPDGASSMFATACILTNSSPYDCTVTFAGGSTRMLPAWTADLFPVDHGQPRISILVSTPSTFTPPPSNATVSATWLTSGESPPNSYPFSLTPNQTQSILNDATYLGSIVWTTGQAPTAYTSIQVTPPARTSAIGILLPVSAIGSIPTSTCTVIVYGARTGTVYASNANVRSGSFYIVPIVIPPGSAFGDTSFYVTASTGIDNTGGHTGYVYALGGTQGIAVNNTNGALTIRTNPPVSGYLDTDLGNYIGLNGYFPVGFLAAQPITLPSPATVTAAERTYNRQVTRINAAGVVQIIAAGSNTAGKRWYITSIQMEIYTPNGALSTFSVNIANISGSGNALAAIASNAPLGTHKEVSWPNGFGLVANAGLWLALDVLTAAFLGESIVTYFEDV